MMAAVRSLEKVRVQRALAVGVRAVQLRWEEGGWLDGEGVLKPCFEEGGV